MVLSANFSYTLNFATIQWLIFYGPSIVYSVTITGNRGIRGFISNTLMEFSEDLLSGCWEHSFLNGLPPAANAFLMGNPRLGLWDLVGWWGGVVSVRV